jgi:hypothetical protein
MAGRVREVCSRGVFDGCARWVWVGECSVRCGAYIVAVVGVRAKGTGLIERLLGSVKASKRSVGGAKAIGRDSSEKLLGGVKVSERPVG